MNVLKQVMVMALALAPEAPAQKNVEWRRFVLRKRGILAGGSPRLRVLLCMDGEVRIASGVAILDTNGGGSGFVLGRGGDPAVGYRVTSPVGDRKSLAEGKSLYDISWFSRFGYSKWTQVHLRTPTRSVATPFPLDYRD